MEDKENIVITRVLGGLGDLVMLRPAVIAYIKTNPDKNVYIKTSKPYDQIVQDIQCAGILIGEDVEGAVEYDLNSPCIQYEMKNHPFLSDGRKIIPSGKEISLSRQEIFCDTLGVKFDINNYNVRFTEEELEFADVYCRNLKNLLIVHCNANEPTRSYKYESLLLEYLAKRWKGNILSIKPNKQTPSGVVVWDDGSIRNLWAVMSKASAFIGVDSGPIHMAGALGIPVYGIFGPIDPAIRLKYRNAFWSDIKCRHAKNKYCWYLPCKGTYCMSRFPKDIYKDAIECFGYTQPIKLHRPKTDIKKIGLIILEGLGGTITATDYIKKVYNLTGKKTDVFIRKNEQIFKDNPHCGKVYRLNDLWYDVCVPVIAQKYDTLIVVKTALAKVYGKQITHDRLYEFSEQFDKLPIGMNELESYGLNLIQMVNYSLGFSTDVESKIYYDERFDGLPDKYIVVSNGVDEDHHGKVLTKCWDKWNDISKLTSIPLVQVGTKNDSLIDGCIDLRGKTNIPELFYVIKSADLVLCQEGGLMHIAYAVGNNNTVVVRGPTRGNIFSYPNQHYVDAEVCSPCYFSRDGWDKMCMSKLNCMSTISVDRVVKRVEEVLCNRQ